MKPINENIKNFIENNQVSSVCFIDENNHPYCINCFYVLDTSSATLIFKSSHGTKHDSLIKNGELTSGTIIEDQIDVSKLKGIQFTGALINQQQIIENKLQLLYATKFPFSIAIPGYLWGVELQYIKFTDNSFVFGNKTIWDK